MNHHGCSTRPADAIISNTLVNAFDKMYIKAVVMCSSKDLTVFVVLLILEPCHM